MNLLRLCLVITSVSATFGCTEERRVDLEPKIYQAYGKSWLYRQTEISSSHRLLAPLHAGGNGYREEHVLEVRQPAARTDRKLIQVPKVIYALQKNGRYKQISCCQYYREQTELFNFENKLVLEFSNARKFITDCFIYPAGHPENERRPKPDQIYGTTVYGEFVPAKGVFIVRSFHAGEYADADFKAQRADRSIEAWSEFMYRHRKPFNCA